MDLKLSLYQGLVNRSPAIQKRYRELRNRHSGRLWQAVSWAALIKWNLIQTLGGRRLEREYYEPDAGRKISFGCPESSGRGILKPQELAERLAEYDVISFDIFDTLLLRPFARPSDLFFVAGERLGCLNYEAIRRQAEQDARKDALWNIGCGEVTLAEICARVSRMTGIPGEEAERAEIQAEAEMCFANPYMKEVFECLKPFGKRLICISDMYLPSDVIRQIMEARGFYGIDRYYISCEYRASKWEGTLYEIVREQSGKEASYVHVGDHPESDGKQARKHGFHTEPYRNVNQAGMSNRPRDMSALTGSVYNGIVNARLYNGSEEYSLEYELGFVYGGLLVTGYCRFIHEYAAEHAADKLLFLSRDGDILHRVYNLLYPGEASEGKTEYVHWSRLAAAKISADITKYDYFRRFLHHKANQTYSMRQIFESMELSDMLPGLCAETGLSQDGILTEQAAERTEEYLVRHWEEVPAHYREESEAAKRYYAEVLRNCKRVCAIDVGWAGSGPMTLDCAVNRIWGLDCEITGLLAGTNTLHSMEPDCSEAELTGGKLVSYLFSQSHNRDLWKFHDEGKGHNLAVEFLLGSEKGSLKKLVWDEEQNRAAAVCKEPDVPPDMVREIHRGILDFAKQWPVWCPISGRDAYAPLRLLLEQKGFLRFVSDIMERNV